MYALLSTWISYMRYFQKIFYNEINGALNKINHQLQFLTHAMRCTEENRGSSCDRPSGLVVNHLPQYHLGWVFVWSLKDLETFGSIWWSFSFRLLLRFLILDHSKLGKKITKTEISLLSLRSIEGFRLFNSWNMWEWVLSKIHVWFSISK